MLVLSDSFCQNPLTSRGFWQRQPIRANIPKSTNVFNCFFANHHKIPQNLKILTFDLKTLQNRKNHIKKLVS
jgi:hypothetical protein